MSKNAKSAENGGGKAAPANKRVIAAIVESTGASQEDAMVMLQMCGGDVNEAVNRLVDSEYDPVGTKSG